MNKRTKNKKEGERKNERKEVKKKEREKASKQVSTQTVTISGGDNQWLKMRFLKRLKAHEQNRIALQSNQETV